LLPFEIPRPPLAKGLTAKDATDTPGIDIGFQTLLMRTPDKLGETALIEAVILFGEGEDNRGESQACDILQITLKVLGITHTKVAHTKLHRPCSHVSGHFANDFRDTQFSARPCRLQIDIGIVALQQPERHAMGLTGDTQEGFPAFELA